MDNLLWRRPRLEHLFDFSYKWEIYFPQSKRQYGYYVMPILYGDSLIGRMDPQLLRKETRCPSNIFRLRTMFRLIRLSLSN
ncbi:hypothetical protein CU633_05850 [Bacillus sp. V3-13]|uniref:DNA glycosylase AlkZ-like family protein n=1 Tax=Bacillus sp. V3-13 TaxID=2053728 RepID=UPI000C7809F1|nr:hypothetical protein CU633_05850 [Bacillus sp. V3-13]